MASAGVLRQIQRCATRRCSRDASLSSALRLFRSMQGKVLEPNLITHNAAISASEKGKKPERAVEVF